VCTAVVPNLIPQIVATDDITDGAGLVKAQSPAAGTEITGVGVHMVTISVTDEANNEANCSVALMLAAFDSANSIETMVPWAVNNGNGSATYAMAATPTTLYVGGNFTWAGATGGSGTGWTNLARFDLATGLVDATWQPVPNGVVRSLALSADGATLYVGGDTFVDALNISTKASAHLVSPTGGRVSALAVSEGYLYYGGSFGSGHYLGVVTLSTGAFYGWMGNVTAAVTAEAVAGDILYVGVPTGIQSLDLTTGAVTAFAAANGTVKGLAASCGAVYAGGAFTTMGGLSRAGLAVLDNAGAVKTNWVPVPNAAVNVLCVTNTSLLGAGLFTTIDGYGFPSYSVRFANTTSPTVTVEQAAGQADPAAVPTSAVPVTFTATFSEPVSGLTAAKIAWSGTATGLTTSITPSSGPAAVYTIKVTASGTGTLIPSIAAGACYGAAGNYNAASTSTDHSVTVTSGSASLSVTSPTSGSYWGVGTTHAITWNAPLLSGAVEIRLYDYTPSPGDAGAHPVTILPAATGVQATAGSWNWTVPAEQAYGTYYRFRVVAAAGSPSGFSGTYTEFGPNDTVAPTVTVGLASGQINPAPTPSVNVPVQFTVQFSEPVTGFDTSDLNWTGTATGVTANLLSGGDSKTWTVRVTASGATGTLVLSIPAGAASDLAHNQSTASPASASVTVGGTPPSTFAITAPASGAYLGKGATQTITWDGSLLTGNASVQLYDYNGNATTNPNYATYVELGVVPAVSGTYSWAVPAGQANGTAYKIRVQALTAAGNPGPYSGYFEIGADTPTLRVTTLNSGSPVFAPGATIPVTWSSYRMSGNVNIVLFDYTAATATQTTLATNVPIANGTWSWVMPGTQTTGGVYKFRVVQNTPALVSDYNDVYFAIGTGTPSVRMTSPNGGETVTRGTPYTVTWNTNAIAGLVTVYMYNYTTGASETIAASVKPAHDGNNTFTWTPAAGHAVGTKFKMRVVNSSAGCSDYSDNYFTIN
jgi:hypothetical protein